MQDPRRSLLSEVILHRFAWRLIVLGVSFVAALSGLLAPWMQKEFIDRLMGVETPLRLVWFDSPLGWILAAFVALILSQAATQLTNYLGAREALILQRLFARRLYDKMLNLKVDTMSKQSLGEVVSLYATDVPGSTVFLDQTLPAGASTLFPLILAPFALSLFFDAPLWPTVGVIVFVSVVNTALAFRQSRFFYRFKQLAAERTGLVNEWVQNIRTLRILGWMSLFENDIFTKREVETRNRVSMVTNGQLMNSISTSVTFFLNIVTLGSLVLWYRRDLSPGEVFALLWILGVFLTRPFRQMPWFFTFAFDAWTSLTRLQRFLDTPEQKTSAPEKTDLPAPREEVCLEVRDLRLEVSGKRLLHDLSFDLKKNEFVAVVGEVGSGKSLLLLSLLRETGASFGAYRLFEQNARDLNDHELRAHFAFAPQEGFIMSATLRDNVWFQYQTPKDKDEAVIKSLSVAQFHLDRERVDGGLDTEIGERGVNLSGGQKQRIGLARAHAARSSIVLLDDSLSAVDVDTEDKLLEQLMFGEWKKTTRLLVTHRLTVLDQVDRILFMKDGRLIAEGRFHDLLEKSAEFREFTQTVARQAEKSPAPPVPTKATREVEPEPLSLPATEVPDGD